MKGIALVQTTNKDVNQLQQNITQSVNPLVANPMTQGNLITGQVLKAGQNTINHSLGYPMTGYLIVALSAASNFYDNLNKVPNPATSFLLYSSQACTVNIYCF